MSSLLLDSVILIDYFNRIDQANSFLNENADRSALSVVTSAEVLVGVEEEAEPKVLQFLDRFPLLGIEGATALAAARFRRRHRWNLPDAFQAAVAKEHDLTLATRNTKDFDPETHDFVVVPYQLSTS